ncbi:MAG: acyltransferase [Candidatus Electrothrix sp. ATG1]|nr:acyltransferase [Candidatus Electrothrix sp. ATG1]
MNLDNSSSERIACLRFPLIIGIVFIHGYAATVDFSDRTQGMAESHWVSNLIRDIISQHLARLAVPLFFLLSGYLFFWGWQWSWHHYGKKLLSRFRSLCVPFLFWNSLTLALLALAQSIPALSSYFPEKGGLTSAYSMYDYLNALLGIERLPVAYQFWFIRDLLVMVLLVPLIQLFLKFFPRGALIVLFSLWFYPYCPWTIPCSTASFFFYAGALLAFLQKDIFSLDRFGRWIILIYSAVLIFDLFLLPKEIHGYIHRAGLVFGIASALYLTKFAMGQQNVRAFLLRAAAWSFFVFAFHEPLLTMTRKIVFYFLRPNSDVVVLTLYFLIPVFVVTVSVVVFSILKRTAPAFLRIIIGGRTTEHSQQC